MDKNGLALESAGILTKKDGARCASRKIGGVKVTDIRLSNDAARRIGRREGRYITLHGEPHTEGMTALLRRALMQILPPRGRLFAAGLGNPDITQDSLGAASVRGLTARRGAKYSLAAIETDVAARTGLETARLVKAASKELRADCVIAIDALSCAEPRFIGKTVQVSNAGIIPGSGAGSPVGELSAERLGCPIVAVGVPTITPLSALTRRPADRDMLISPSDVDILIKMWAEVISGAINSIVE